MTKGGTRNTALLFLTYGTIIDNYSSSGANIAISSYICTKRIHNQMEEKEQPNKPSVPSIQIEQMKARKARMNKDHFNVYKFAENVYCVDVKMTSY